MQLGKAGKGFPALRAEILFVQNALRGSVLIGADDPHKVDHRLAPVTGVTGQLQPVTVGGSCEGGVTLRESLPVVGELVGEAAAILDQPRGGLVAILDAVGGQGIGSDQVAVQPDLRLSAGASVALEEVKMGQLSGPPRASGRRSRRRFASGDIDTAGRR